MDKYDIARYSCSCSFKVLVYVACLKFFSVFLSVTDKAVPAFVVK